MHMSEWTVEVIRAAYQLDDELQPWLARLAAILARSVPGAGSWLGAGFRVTSRGLVPLALTSAGVDMGLINPVLDVCASASPELHAVFASRRCGVGSLRSWNLLGVPEIQKHLRSVGSEDCFFVFAVTSDDTGCGFLFPCQYRARTSQSLRWQRVLPHIADGWRFRHLGGHVVGPSQHASGFFAVAGGALRGACSWQQLAIAADAELGQPVHRTAIEALWQQVIDGRGSRIVHFAHAGRRYLVVRKLDPELGSPLALTRRERRVVQLAADVAFPSQGEIAREMACKESTMATHLGRAMKKLGMRGRTELIALMAGRRSGE